VTCSTKASGNSRRSSITPIRAGELDPGADARALAVLICLVMQGMAQQARDGATRDEL
jgi:hypothetical protein